jgi:hypothetical protein
MYVRHVEIYYFKRPILCLASSKILTLQPPLRPASVFPPPAFVAGGGHTVLAGQRGWLCSPGGEGGGGGQYLAIFWKTQDAALYSTYIESSLVRHQIVLNDAVVWFGSSSTPSPHLLSESSSGEWHTVAKFIVPSWGIKSTMPEGYRTGPPLMLPNPL